MLGRLLSPTFVLDSLTPSLHSSSSFLPSLSLPPPSLSLKKTISSSSSILFEAPPTPDWKEYKHALTLPPLSSSLPSFQRLDCCNPAIALSHYLYPPSLFSPSSCSPKEALEAWQEATGLKESLFPHHSYCESTGVRETLYQTFLHALSRQLEKTNQNTTTTTTTHNKFSIWIPEDVYPRYEQLLQEALLTLSQQTNTPLSHLHQSFTLYTFPTFPLKHHKPAHPSRTLHSSLPFLHQKDEEQLVVLPLPLSPIGRFLYQNETELLSKHFASPPSSSSSSPSPPHRTLFLDCVYTYNYPKLTNSLSPLLSNPTSTILSFSLSKSYLSPFLTASPLPNSKSTSYGPTLLPSSPLSPFSSLSSSLPSPPPCTREKARNVLVSQPDLPSFLNNRFEQEWEEVGKKIREVDPKWEAPENGYFSIIEKNWINLLDHDILSVPASAFGEPPPPTPPPSSSPSPLPPSHSVLTCLYDIKEKDEKKQKNTYYHVTALSNFASGYDKYSRVYDKGKLPVETTYPDRFYLLQRHNLDIGIKKAGQLIQKTKQNGITNDQLLLLETTLPPSSPLLPSPSGFGVYLPSSQIPITAVHLSPHRFLFQGSPPPSPYHHYYGGERGGEAVEEVMAMSLKCLEPVLKPYKELTPRTMSVLPVAIGCQARCPFCFSHSSASLSQSNTLSPLPPHFSTVLQHAKERGANRFVVTGGGEPFMLPFDSLSELVGEGGRYFPRKVVIITNGYAFTQWEKEEKAKATKNLEELVNNGLNVLAISRHGATEEQNKKIMFLETKSGGVKEVVKNSEKLREGGVVVRWVCVLQRGGVEDEGGVERYFDWVCDGAEGVETQICFKELYVSTSIESKFHDQQSNVWSRKHQVPLKLIIDFCKKHNFEQVSQLPWGSPVFKGEWKGKTLQVAAYTEPSVMWERENGLLRSWNMMSDGSVLASLEDAESVISF